MATKNTAFEYLKGFLDQDGISGYEHAIAKYFALQTKKNGAEITYDGFGSVIAKVGTKGPKIMLAAHMDEVGFVVERIEKQGMLRLSPIGGFWTHVILASKVKVVTTDKKVFYGVIGSTSVHALKPEQRTKVLEFNDIYLDLGFDSEADVRKAGIDIGDQVIRVSEPTLLANGDKYSAKAIDNRVGVAIIAKVIEEINQQNIKLQSQVFAVATAQEEVGLRGARASTSKIIPDLAIAIDTIPSSDTPNVTQGVAKLGDGAAIVMKDNTALPNPILANMVFDLARSKKIPAYKYVSLTGGGNDSGETQFSIGGIPILSIAVPTRYLHTPFEVSSIKDFEANVKLLVEFIKILNQNILDEIKKR